MVYRKVITMDYYFALLAKAQIVNQKAVDITAVNLPGKFKFYFVFLGITNHFNFLAWLPFYEYPIISNSKK